MSAVEQASPGRLERTLVALLLAGPAALGLFGRAEAAGPNCPIDNSGARPIHLYFPAAGESGPPAGYFGACTVSLSGLGINTGFNPLDLGQSTTVNLQAPVLDVVKAAFCELNADVVLASSAPYAGPSPPDTDATIVITSDAHTAVTGDHAFGRTANQTYCKRGFSRVWAGTYNQTGPTATDEWAYAIGGTAAHEAAHTFGISHECCSAPCTGCYKAPGKSLTCDCGRAGENADEFLMWSTGPADAAHNALRKKYRHFSDETFSYLASRIGLSVNAMYDWEMVNWSNSPISYLELDVVRKNTPVTVTSQVIGSFTTVDPPVAKGTQSFNGTSGWKKYTMRWRSGPLASTCVPSTSCIAPGATFTFGVSFNQSDVVPVAIRLYGPMGATGAPTPIGVTPRIAGFVTGIAPNPQNAVMASSQLTLTFTAQDPAGGLSVSGLKVGQLQRPAAPASMVQEGSLKTWDGIAITPTSEQSFAGGALKDGVTIAIAPLNQPRGLFPDPSGAEAPQKTAQTVEHGGGGFDGIEDSGGAGGADDPQVFLFPSTTVYVSGTLTDEHGSRWDPNAGAGGAYVTGPVSSRFHYQFSGFHPDFDHNGVDDAIDIANGAHDWNHDGVPDRVQRYLLATLAALGMLLLLLIALTIWLIRRFA